MRTLGVDLAAQPTKTALCLIDWGTDRATVVDVRVGVSDQDIIDSASELNLPSAESALGDAIGIDAPFGWPQPFVEFVSQPPKVTGSYPAWKADRQKELCFRLTDLRIREEVGLVPLSVAADKIAVAAMRCAGILDALRVVDRSGVDGVFEVYPAAALKAWGFPYKGYKPRGRNRQLALDRLAKILGLVSEACAWPSFSDGIESRCRTNDDAFDALIASLVARAAALGKTSRPIDENENQRARVEGWIAIPTKECPIGDLWP
jgi:hypothetical protein